MCLRIFLTQNVNLSKKDNNFTQMWNLMNEQAKWTDSQIESRMIAVWSVGEGGGSIGQKRKGTHGHKQQCGLPWEGEVVGGGGVIGVINGDGQRFDWGDQRTIQCIDDVL